MPGRRPLSAFVALFTLPMSACLHLGTPAPPVAREEAPKTIARANDPQAPQDKFASLPRVPGTVVFVNPQPKPSAAANNGTNPAPKTPSPPQPLPPNTLQITANNVEPLRPPTAQPNLPPESPVLAAVRAYTEGQPKRAIEIIRTLDKPNQDFVLEVLPILVRGASADLTNDSATVGVLVDQLDGARSRLEQRAALRVDNVTFCKDVAGFGRFVPRAPNEPYKPNTQAQLYLEVKNLGSRSSGSEFIAHIHAAVEIRDAHGKLVEQIDPEDYRRRVPSVRFDKRLVSHSPLHDFHVLYIFSVPAAPGVYTISAELRCAATGRTVKTQPAQFCVAGP